MVFERRHLLIPLLALAGAGGGLWLGSLLAPQPTPAPLPAAQPRPGLVGSPAPAFSRPDLAGEPRSLEDWRGKLRLVNFWASWCDPCRREMPLLERTQERHAARGLQVIGIADEAAEAARSFLARHPLGYPTLFDDPALGDNLSLRFGNTRSLLPYTVLVDRDGRILASHFGELSEHRLEAWLAPHLE